LGTFVLIIGFVLAIIQRFKEFKRREAQVKWVVPSGISH
jgi:hypothetical protein